MELRGKAVLVTGASRGLGAALSRRLAARGARVVAVAREREPLERLVAAIRSDGGEAHALSADVGDKFAILPLVGAAAGLVGNLDVLVNNASTLGPTPLRPLLDTECEDLERVLAVNLVGPFRLTKAVAGAMAVNGAGLAVNVSSDASVGAYPTWGAYSVSKAGLDHLTRIFAAELGAFGVRFFSVDPGEMDTTLHAEAMPEADPATLARPEHVAGEIVGMIEASDRIESGSRLEASSWSAR
jgi:NAD(P)-dependent dehydrogenase (short-subunit alcohol dehydrogenase family)